MKKWIISSNIRYYDSLEAFAKLNIIDWGTKYNIEKGDIVYIYVSNCKKILFKTIVVHDNIPERQLINDNVFYRNKNKKKKRKIKKYVRLKIIKSFLEMDKEFYYYTLQKHGLKSTLQGAIILNKGNNKEELLNYIYSIDKQII